MMLMYPHMIDTELPRTSHLRVVLILTLQLCGQEMFPAAPKAAQRGRGHTQTLIWQPCGMILSILLTMFLIRTSLRSLFLHNSSIFLPFVLESSRPQSFAAPFLHLAKEIPRALLGIKGTRNRNKSKDLTVRYLKQ